MKSKNKTPNSSSIEERITEVTPPTLQVAVDDISKRLRSEWQMQGPFLNFDTSRTYDSFAFFKNRFIERNIKAIYKIRNHLSCIMQNLNE